MKSTCICLCEIKTLRGFRMFNSRSEDAEGKEKSILGKSPYIEQLKSKEINGKPNIKNN